MGRSRGEVGYGRAIFTGRRGKDLRTGYMYSSTKTGAVTSSRPANRTSIFLGGRGDGEPVEVLEQDMLDNMRALLPTSQNPRLTTILCILPQVKVMLARGEPNGGDPGPVGFGWWWRALPTPPKRHIAHPGTGGRRRAARNICDQPGIILRRAVPGAPHLRAPRTFFIARPFLTHTPVRRQTCSARANTPAPPPTRRPHARMQASALPSESPAAAGPGAPRNSACSLGS